jgi:hypothetical protein
MAYALHIERNSNPISLEEWSTAVKEIEGIRLAEGSVEIKNPKTGEIISMPSSPGDVSVLFRSKGFLSLGKKQEWLHCIRFFKGRGSFNAAPGIESPDNPVHMTAVRLAKSLGAQIVGEEGEPYQW